MQEENSSLRNFSHDEIKDYLREKIVAVRYAMHFNQKDFAKSISMSPSYINEVESGKSMPNAVLLFSLIRIHSVNANWLFAGEGSMFKRDAAEDVSSEDAAEVFMNIMRDTVRKVIAETTVEAIEDEVTVRRTPRNDSPKGVRRLRAAATPFSDDESQTTVKQPRKK
ncbi:MAG: helix-turn-helix transcriptional regulator [Candidatus Kapabacteria bacterium]|nr:helix-turn-helix transcriptional regulator [Candidatus Kapabacteria bacterium]